MRHERSTQVVAGVSVVGVAVVLLGCGLTRATAQATPASERGVEVVLTNDTSCRLQLAAIRLEHGVWTKVPRAVIKPGTTAHASVAAVRAEGVAGTISYRSIGCANLRHDGRSVSLHWTRAGDGRAAGAFTGTDPAFTTWFFASTETKVNAHVSEEGKPSSTHAVTGEG